MLSVFSKFNNTPFQSKVNEVKIAINTTDFTEEKIRVRYWITIAYI